MISTQRGAEIERLEKQYPGACDLECGGRCIHCPDDVFRELIAIARELLAALPAERQAGFEEAREAAAQLASIHQELIRKITPSTETPRA